MGDVKNFRFKTSQGNYDIPVKDTVARERIGDLDELHTQHKDNLVNAINDLEGGSGGTTDYNNLDNKPSINGVTLVGDKTTEDLGIEGVTDYDELENKPTINGVELEGNLSSEDLEIEYNDILNRPVESGDLDIDAVVDPLPTVVSKSNVVFDERGTEYEDGIYIKEIDGTAMYKPVYRKDYIRTGVTNGTTTLESDFYNSNSAEIVTKIEAIRRSESDVSTTVVLNDYYNPNINYSSGNFEIIMTGTGAYWTCRVSIEYTKTTDTWQEYEEDTQ